MSRDLEKQEYADWDAARHILSEHRADSLVGREWCTRATAAVTEYREQCEAAARADERAHLVVQFKGAADYAEDSADLIRRYEDIVARLRKEQL
jgi:hypothetical protein